jgi:hypothetical protein
MTSAKVTESKHKQNSAERSDKQPFWKFDRDLTNAMSNEASAGRQPVADQYSPVADLPAADDHKSPPLEK